MTDTPKQIQTKINKYAFSGGGATLEEHRRLGGDPEVDVPYQYISFFMEDDEELENLAVEYRSGRLLTGEMKKKCIELMQKVVREFQEVSATCESWMTHFVADFNLTGSKSSLGRKT